MLNIRLKKYALLLFLCIGFLSVKSQKLKWGLKGGINFSDVNGNAFPGDTANTLIGYHAGFFCTIKLPIISIQPELLVSTAGAKLRTNDVAQKFKLTYISMPIMLQFKVFPATYLEAGPQFGYKIGEDISSGNFRGFIENLDASVGGGVRFKLLFLSAYARYMAGISKVGDFNSSSTPNFKNSLLQVGLCLHLKGKR
jgi:hypothetical protein